MRKKFEECCKYIRNLFERNFGKFKKKKGWGLFIWRKFFEYLNENPRTVKEKCRENLKEISLEFDKNLWKISEKSEVLRKYNGNLREV